MKRSEIKRRPLADTTISNLEPEDKEYRELDGNALYLRVKPNGQKSWQLRYKKANGKWSWHGLGSYPKVTAQSARAETFRINTNLSKGIQLDGTGDPSRTFKQAAEEWIEQKAIAGRVVRQMRIYLDKDMLPELGHKSLVSITRADCMRVQQRLEARDALRSAEKVRGWLAGIFSREIAQGNLELNPASELNALAIQANHGNFPWLLESELPEFLICLRRSRSHIVTRTATWLLLRTASRPFMVRFAEWLEMDLDNGMWEIPAAKMKKRRNHLVPLSRQTVKDLRELRAITGRSRYLFPGQGDNEVISDNSMNQCIKRCGFTGKLVGHGSRHTASTLLNEHEFNERHIDIQLSHKLKGTRGVYNKAQYLKQRIEMMQWYADYLDILEEKGRQEEERKRKEENTRIFSKVS